jgi:hypothetical protein
MKIHLTYALVTTFESKLTREGPVHPKQGQCWQWLGAKAGDGYGSFRFRGFWSRAHRLSYSLYVGSIPEGLSVLHRCDNPMCVNPSHLFVGSQKDNVQDTESKHRGNHPKRERHGRAVLTEGDVQGLRERYSRGESKAHLARVFGISQTHTARIINGKAWNHVD